MKKCTKILILLILIAALVAGIGFASIEKVYAEPNANLSGTLSGASKTNCDGKELNAFNLYATYSVNKTDSGSKLYITLPAEIVSGISLIANTTSWKKTIQFVSDFGTYNTLIDASTPYADITAEWDIANPKYNNTYNMSVTVEGRHGYIGHATHYWWMSLTGSFAWGKDAPTLSFTNVSNGGSTSSDVKVSSDSTDATVEYKHNSSVVDTVASDEYSKVISTEGRHDFIIKNNYDSANLSSSYYFIIDKSAPTGALNGVGNGGYTNQNVTFTWNDAEYNEAAVTATLDGNAYHKDTVITTDGKHSIVISDSAGNSNSYTFTIKKTMPVGILKGVTNGGQTNSNVSLTWSEDATAMLNGADYVSGRTIYDSGNYTLILTDIAGNSITYTFKIDMTRAYLSNIEYIKSIFSLSNSESNRLSAGQVGNYDTNLGRALPGIEFNWADELSTFNVTLTQSLYQYNHATGEYTTDEATSSAVAGNIKLTKPGEYIMRATDALGNETTLRFILGVNIKFTPGDFVHKADRYILGNESIANIISYNADGNYAGATIYIDDANIDIQALTLDDLESYLAGKGERDKSARIKLISNFNGVEYVYFDYQVGYDFSDADIHNIESLIFEAGSGSYLGTIKPGVKFDFGALVAELDETATLIQTLYAYDGRNVLYVKDEQTVIYTSGLMISNNGYYVLKINDSSRVTEYTFKVLDEFKSANEYSLKNEYFIAPEFNQVKLPMSFGTFNISHRENIADTYIGKYSAEKTYLFSTSENTAQAFAFAAEYSVCVQNTATGYLYRAKNQGIQVAYNNYSQLSNKIREVVKEYVSYESMKIADSQSIDYSTQVIMDDSLKYNGNYENVAEQTIGGVTYANILLINKGFVFRANAGRDVLSSLAKITITNIETAEVYNVQSGAALSDVTTLNGIYKIEENCPGSNMILTYYVYLDNVAPTADISSSKADGTATEQTVTAADTIVLQVAEFNLKSLTDLIDNYCMVYISGYGFSDAIAVCKGELKNIRITTALGHKGAYTIEIYDRSKNKFSFMLYIMGAAPEATFTKSGSGDTEHVILNITTDKYCTVMGLSIYRNKTENNTGELTHDSDNTEISSAVLRYIFKQGGRYTIVISDNFERSTTIELRYIKDMPNIAVDGLNKERRVNKDVTVTLPLNCLYTVVTAKNSTITVESMTDTSSGIIVIVIRPRNEYNELVYLEDKVTIKAWYEADPDSYNDLSYMLDTIAPKVMATSESGELLSGTLFKQAIKLEYDADVESIDVQRNGRYFSYTKGQVIRLDGEYIANAADIAGNKAILQVVLDMTVDYSVIYDDNKSYLSGIEKVDGRAVTVAASIMLTANEQISVVAVKDGYTFNYSMADKISAAGVYKFILSDNAGNEVTLDYRVLPSVQNISLLAEDGSLLTYNSTTNQSIYLDWDDLSYIRSVSYKQSNSMGYFEYIKKELIIKSGSYTVTVEDVLSNTLDIRINIDKEVNIDVKYDKSYTLEEIDYKANTLTKRFSISLNESNINLSIKLNGEPISYLAGAWIIANGVYEVHAIDVVGNVYSAYVTVVGESLPRVNVVSISGKPVADKANIKEGFSVSWSAGDYIARVDINYNRIENGAAMTADGKYTVDITDLLDRTKTMTIWIKTKINYSINYQGSHVIIENSTDVILTRGFSFTSEDSLEIAATKSGENFAFSMYRLYATAGDYVLNITDIAGNEETIKIRVIEIAYLPKVADKNGAELKSGDIINNQFEILKSVYISKILINGVVYNYGDYINIEGKNKIEVEDVIGRGSVIYITIDTLVDCDVTYGIVHDKTTHVLSNKFSVTLNEQCTTIAKLNSNFFEFKAGASYTVTGLYELTITDSLGNVKNLKVEVDNRTPNVNIIDKNGNTISNVNINEEFFLTWDDLLNIREVKVNGATINSGTGFASAGRYEIVMTNHLGNAATRVITIQDKVIYELTMHGNSYEYEDNGNNTILTAGFSITGSSIVNIQGKLNGIEITVLLGKNYNIDGLYEITLTDNAGNTITLYINVVGMAVKGGITISDLEVTEDISINTAFIIVGHRFIKEIYVNGVMQTLGNEFIAEGVYNIEYVDNLGRKASQRIVIDKTVSLTWEYKHIKHIGDIDVYLATALKLNSSEALTYIVQRDELLIEVFDSAVILKINGLYHIIAKDALGNELAFWVRVDNIAPIIITASPNADNSVNVSINDDISFSVEVYLNGELYLSNLSEFCLKSNGKFTIIAVDELGNKIEQTKSTDMFVSLTYNFLLGQSINFKPTFSADEIISYEMYCNDKIVEGYKLNDQLNEIGRYKLSAKDELDNSIEITFTYHGSSRKQPLMSYKLPDIEGLIYKVLFEGQPIELEAVDGVLTLAQTGNYTLIYLIDGREQSYSVDIINTPPKINLNSYFKSKDDLRTSKKVDIDSASGYVIYRNGVEIKSSSSVDKVGRYKIVATDEVGNVGEIEFVIYYAPNGGTVMLIIITLLVAVVILLFILKRKGVFNKKTNSKRKKASQ